MEQCRNERVEETRDPREKSPTSGIVRHDSHMRKSGFDPAGNRTLFTLVGDDQNRRGLMKLRKCWPFGTAYLRCDGGVFDELHASRPLGGPAGLQVWAPEGVAATHDIYDSLPLPRTSLSHRDASQSRTTRVPFQDFWTSMEVSAESLIEARYRRQDCTTVRCFARRGDERVDAHVSIAPSAPTLLDLRPDTAVLCRLDAIGRRLRAFLSGCVSRQPSPTTTLPGVEVVASWAVFIPYKAGLRLQGLSQGNAHSLTAAHILLTLAASARVPHPHGSPVTDRLACSPPTEANRVRSPAGSLRILVCGNRAGRCRRSAGFLGISRYPRPFIPAMLYTHLNHANRLLRPRWDVWSGTLECGEKGVGVGVITPSHPRGQGSEHQVAIIRPVTERREKGGGGVSAVVKWSDYSSPGECGSGRYPDVRTWELFRPMSLVGRFCWESAPPPKPPRSTTSLYSPRFTLSDSQDLAVTTFSKILHSTRLTRQEKFLVLSYNEQCMRYVSSLLKSETKLLTGLGLPSRQGGGVGEGSPERSPLEGGKPRDTAGTIHTKVRTSLSTAALHAQPLSAAATTELNNPTPSCSGNGLSRVARYPIDVVYDCRIEKVAFPGWDMGDWSVRLESLLVQHKSPTNKSTRKQGRFHVVLDMGSPPVRVGRLPWKPPMKENDATLDSASGHKHQTHDGHLRKTTTAVGPSVSGEDGGDRIVHQSGGALPPASTASLLGQYLRQVDELAGAVRHAEYFRDSFADCARMPDPAFVCGRHRCLFTASPCRLLHVHARERSLPDRAPPSMHSPSDSHFLRVVPRRMYCRPELAVRAWHVKWSGCHI
ncbi:hypothetical protein PR048_031105 [Dryococelus australis]|uniref:Uncharacterized protein n=1 Tax=Dryococelus australis TaxID=614101 RepID=A0ABQ9G4B8_9NEOP|nr:hypothetical protein PR048_031105 [Dryococelus australis]